RLEVDLARTDAGLRRGVDAVGLQGARVDVGQQRRLGEVGGAHDHTGSAVAPFARGGLHGVAATAAGGQAQGGGERQRHRRGADVTKWTGRAHEVPPAGAGWVLGSVVRGSRPLRPGETTIRSSSAKGASSANASRATRMAPPAVAT